MVKVNHHIPEKQITALRKMSKQTGLSVAELIRRAVEIYVEKHVKG